MTLLFDSITEAERKIPINKTLRILVNGQALCLIHTQTGFKAIADECPHLGESLSKGKVNYLQEIVCPWHSYRFSLQSGEEMTGKNCKDLKFYAILIENDKLYVDL